MSVKCGSTTDNLTLPDVRRIKKLVFSQHWILITIHFKGLLCFNTDERKHWENENWAVKTGKEKKKRMQCSV